MLVTHKDHLAQTLQSTEFSFSSESDEEIGNFALRVVYQLPDFRDSSEIVNEIIEESTYEVRTCRPLNFEPESAAQSSFVTTYLEDDPLVVTLPAWTYETQKGLNENNPTLRCNSTITTKILQQVETSPGVTAWKRVDAEWTPFDMVET